MTTFQFPPDVIRQAFEKFQATLSQDLKFQLNGRLERGLSIAMTGGVASYDDNTPAEYQQRFRVRSSDLSKPPYLVDLSERSCTCPDHWKGHYCKHRLAANIIKAAILTSKIASPNPTKATPKETIPVPQLETKTADTDPVQPSSTNEQKDAIVWGVVRLNGEILGVEVISIEGEQAKVRALPKVIDGKKLQPQFPFEGKHSTASIPKKELFHVKIFQ
jgi:SWIM zinc finger